MASASESRAALEVNKGIVGGSAIWAAADAALTRPADATATAVNGAIGSASSALFTFTDFFEAVGAHELLTGMRLTISLASIAIPSGIAIRAHLFNTDVKATVLSANADKGVYKEMLAAQASKLGYVDFTTWTIGGAGSDAIESYGVPIISPLHLRAADTGRALYAILVATAVFTPVNAGVHTLRASRSSL